MAKSDSPKKIKPKIIFKNFFVLRSKLDFEFQDLNSNTKIDLPHICFDSSDEELTRNLTNCITTNNNEKDEL